MKSTQKIAVVLSALTLISCSNEKGEPPLSASQESAAHPTDIVCSYAPSQSAVVANLSSGAGGSAAVVAALAQALGLSVVPHSTGALILTGGSGYIAGTIGAAAAGPVVIGVGVLAAGSAGVVEILCAPKNHPDMVAKVHAAAAEFASRSSRAASESADVVRSFVAERRIALMRTGEEAIAYANRKSIEVSEALKQD
jgi:hypothetical protein